MIDPQDISLSIGSHGVWKQRLARAIKTGDSDFTPSQVESDTRCDFGRWLASIDAADRDPVHFATVKELHAAFHKEAANVLRMAFAGQKDAAEKSMAPEGAYSTISRQLTSATTAWKKATGG
jgi:hypothetical protein